MIRLVTGDLEAHFSDIVETFGIFGTKIYAQYQQYGVYRGPLDLWICCMGDYPAGVISRLDGFFTIAGGDRADALELAEFLGAVGGGAAEGGLPPLERLNAVIRGGLCPSRILRYEESLSLEVIPHTAAAPCADGVPRIERACALTDVYRLLCRADAQFGESVPYGAWLTDVSHKQRHQLADVWILKVNDEIVSTFGSYFKGQQRGILACAATAPEYRGRGYMRLLAAHAAQALLREGLEPWLLTRTDALASFWEACGFRPVGDGATLTFPRV